ncbi:MAG: hypothetical protein RL021_266 [Bacteroidota bacterium]
MRLFLSFLLFISAAQTASASYRLTPDVAKAQELVFQLRFKEAAPLLLKAEKDDPANLLVASVRCKQYFLTAFLDEQEASAEFFENAAESLHDRIDADMKKGEDRFAAFVKGELLVFQVLLHTRDRKFIAAAWELNSCHSLITRNTKRYPDFLPNELVHGAVTAVLGAIPPEYEWLLRMVGLDGNVESGKGRILKFIKSCPSSPYFCLMDEAVYTLTSLQYTLTPDQPMDPFLLERLEKQSPGSDLLKYAFTGLLQKTRENDRALSVLGDEAAHPGTLEIPFIHLRRGQLLSCKLDPAAEPELLRFLRDFKGNSFVKAGWQRVAWLRYLRGDLAGYHAAMVACKSSGVVLFDDDKDAQQEAESGMPPNRYLLKARLYFDGGYYAEAMKSITGIPSDSFPSVRDKLELTYRYARILEGMDRKEQAVNYYEKTIKNGENSRYYFAANSALLLGQYYEDKKDFAKARLYYERCLLMRDHEYQNGIDQKAKAGMARVGGR